MAIYEDRGLQWAQTHARAGRRDDAETFAAEVGDGVLRLDIGCGAGRYAPHLGEPLIGLDASPVMLNECRVRVPGALYVQGDVEALPFATRSLGGAWSCMTHLHMPRSQLPVALWDLQRVLAVGAPFDIQVLAGDYEGNNLPDDDVGGRFFAGWQPGALADVVAGAGFEVEPGFGQNLRRRGAVTGPASPNARRHRRSGHAPPDLRPEPQRVLGGCRCPFCPSGKSVLARGGGRRPGAARP